MKSLLIVLFLLFISYSCCHKKGCLDGENIQVITIENFTQQESDTIRLTAYLKNTNYQTVIDSFFVFDGNINNTSTAMVYLPRYMRVEYDWKVFFPGTGATYLIDRFMFKKLVCNACFLGNDYYQSLESYHINGFYSEGNVVTIKK